MIVSSRSFLISYSPTLIIPGKGEPKIGIQVRTSVTPGRLPEYLKWARENAMVAVGKTDAKGLYVGVVGLGGNPNEVQVAVQFDNFEDMGKFVQAYGKAMADLKLQTNAPVGVESHVEFAVYRYVPELSIASAPAKAAGQ